jgi:hypothetical protein
MTRIIVETIDDMPGSPGNRGGLPLGCVLETDGPTVLAHGEGATFSSEGLERIAQDMQTFTAIWRDIPDNEGQTIEVRALDLQAALQWLARHYHGPFELWVDAAPVYLGEFE